METPHISVCICTYKRPELLRRLLKSLASQRTEGRFTFSIVISDNDRFGSAEVVVEEFKAAPIPITYCVEPQQNIALARNRAIEHAKGDFVAFFDDDQFATDHWLCTLFSAWLKYRCDGVLGPVKPHFDAQPPNWVIRGKFYERPTYPTGLVIDWRKGRTGNVLLRRSVFAGEERAFRPMFLTGEDQDFFRRMIEKGFVFVWCDEAVGYETVPPNRWRRSFMVKRALLRGRISLEHPTSKTLELAKSAIALPVYTAALPFFFLGGQHLFMKYLIKACDHAGRLLAFARIHPVRESYVTE